MKIKMICALFTATALAAGAMAGCHVNKDAKENSTATEAIISTADSAAVGTADSAPFTVQLKNEPAYTAKLAPLKATRLETIKINHDEIIDVTPFPSGLVYTTKDNRYGVMTHDGKKDTGAKYTYAGQGGYINYIDRKYSRANEYYMMVRDNTGKEKSVNCWGLLDENMQEIIPCQYASLSIMNERYVQVFTAKNDRLNETAANTFMLDAGMPKMYIYLQFNAESAGKWEIYDLKERKLVEGLSDTHCMNLAAKGQFLIQKDYAGEDLIYDPSGKKITDGRKVLSNGDYIIEINGRTAVYSTEGERLFNYDATEFEIYDYMEPYYLAKTVDNDNRPYYITDPKPYGRDAFSYVLVNDEGKIVSGKFDHEFTFVFPDFVLSDGKVCKLDGTELFDERFDFLAYDDVNRDAYLAAKKKSVAFFDSDGNVLFKGDGDKESFKCGNNFEANEESGFYGRYFCDHPLFDVFNDNDKHYDFGSKDFTIDGKLYDCTDDWLVFADNGLIDTRSGNELLGKKYKGGNTVKDSRNHITYAYAFDSINGHTQYNSFPVFTISPDTANKSTTTADSR